MQVIYKYPIRLDSTVIAMPKFAKPLCVQVQRGEPYIWAMIDPAQSLEDTEIRVVATGELLESKSILGSWDFFEAAKYLGTFQLFGALVFHIYYRE